jgi:hypothetical protein
LPPSWTWCRRRRRAIDKPEIGRRRRRILIVAGALFY